jgi:hypothetical protein
MAEETYTTVVTSHDKDKLPELAQREGEQYFRNRPFKTTNFDVARVPDPDVRLGSVDRRIWQAKVRMVSVKLPGLA